MHSTMMRAHTCADSLDTLGRWHLSARARLGELSWSHSQMHKTEPMGTCWEPSKTRGFHFTSYKESQQSVAWGHHGGAVSGKESHHMEKTNIFCVPNRKHGVKRPHPLGYYAQG